MKDFTGQALKGKTVILRATDSDGETITETFQLAGLADALKKLPCAREGTF